MNITFDGSQFFFKRKFLPEIPAIYFIFDDNEDCLYIGKTINLRNRLNGHDKIPYIRNNYIMPIVRWIATSKEDLTDKEAQFIKLIKPTLNIRKTRPNISSRSVKLYRQDARLLKLWADEGGDVKPLADVLHELIEREKARREREAAGVKQA